MRVNKGLSPRISIRTLQKVCSFWIVITTSFQIGLVEKLEIVQFEVSSLLRNEG